MKIVTKNYGEQEVLFKKSIKGLKNLYVAEILGKKRGIIDSNKKEILPFGDCDISGFRVIDGKYLLIKEILTPNFRGEGNHRLGTSLYLVKGNELELLCTSEGIVMEQLGNYLYGQHENLNDNSVDYQYSFIYDLKSNQEAYKFGGYIMEITNNGNPIIHEYCNGDRRRYILNLNNLSQPIKRFKSISLNVDETGSKLHITGYLAEMINKCGEEYVLYCFLNENGEITSDIYNTYIPYKTYEKDSDFEQIISEFKNDIENGDKLFDVQLYRSLVKEFKIQSWSTKN